MDDPGGVCFRYEHPEYKMSFIALGGDGDETTLMYFRAFEQAKFLAVSVWLAERQHLWAEWRAIAEATNGYELSRHMTSIHDGGPFENFLEPLLIVEREYEPEVTFAARLVTRRVEILRHRFETLKHRDAFLGWVNNGATDPIKWDLALTGLLEGRNRLASHIDKVVKVQIALRRNSAEDRAIVKAAEHEFGQRVLRALETGARAENVDDD